MISQVGARASSLVIASLLLGAGCMSGDHTGSKTDPGTAAAGADDGATTDDTGTGAPVSPLAVNNLASDQAGQAQNLGSAMVNAWGIVAYQGMFWIANEATGKVSIVDGNGAPSKGKVASDSLDLGEGITGVTVNDMASDTTMFQIHGETACMPANLIFASTGGKLIGVNTDLSMKDGFVLVDRSKDEASYLGVAMIHGAKAPLLLAADFHNGRIDVFDSEFAMVTDVKFVDADVPDGFAPFNVMAFGDRVYVTYAKQDDMKEDEVTGPGLGVLAVFDTSGTVIGTVKSDLFNAPWGMAMANGFGPFPDALLVGNFGDGHVTAIDVSPAATSMSARGQLMGTDGAAIEIDGLWGISMGDGVTSAKPGLYFAAGPDDEMHGMFGLISTPPSK
jgi:uncharacterized protein (TIGR03118 family)